MRLRLALAVALLAAPAMPALAAPAGAAERLPSQLDARQREQYRAIFAAIQTNRWSAAEAALAAMGDGPLHPIARAELYTARGSPKVELAPLMALLERAPELPKADQIARLATLRGATALPPLPGQRRISWLGGAPIRSRAENTRGDAVAAELSAKVSPLIDRNSPAEAESLVETAASRLSPQALTEWRQRVAWSYYITGDDSSARRIAAKAQRGVGEWAVQADWVAGLAAWRQRDCANAGRAFQRVAANGGDSEMRAAGHFWAARADTACGSPEQVQARLRAAARMPETFYGLLAMRSLGIAVPKQDESQLFSADWRHLSEHPNVRVALALAEIGETDLAEEALRHQLRIGDERDHDALLRLAGRMNLPETQIWLAHNGPAGAAPEPGARYPAPDWTPERGWRVDKSLVYAHALQESRFRADVVSPAGAHGLMQVRPGTAGDIARKRGGSVDRSQLFRPSTNLEYGQSYLEYLRDYRGTQGLLPKVIAAYNAGPAPVDTWNGRAIGQGDPLLYIESIPYWETRGYVPIVLRNYWMYQQNAGEDSASLKAIAQGMWPRFPGLPGATAIRMPQPGAARVASAD